MLSHARSIVLTDILRQIESSIDALSQFQTARLSAVLKYLRNYFANEQAHDAERWEMAAKDVVTHQVVRLV